MDNKSWNKLLRENTLVTEETEFNIKKLGTILDKKTKSIR